MQCQSLRHRCDVRNEYIWKGHNGCIMKYFWFVTLWLLISHRLVMSQSRETLRYLARLPIITKSHIPRSNGISQWRYTDTLYIKHDASMDSNVGPFRILIETWLWLTQNLLSWNPYPPLWFLVRLTLKKSLKWPKNSTQWRYSIYE